MTQGGGVAAPVGGQVLSEVLPYLELQKDNEEESEKRQEVEVPEIRNKTILEAEKQLKEMGLELQINNIDENSEINKSETIIVEQTPKPGIKILNGAKVYVDI